MLEWLPLRIEAASTKLHSLLTRQLLYGVLLGFSLSVTSTSLALYFQERKRQRVQEQFEPRPIELRSDEVVDGVTGLIGRSLGNKFVNIQHGADRNYREYSIGEDKLIEQCTGCRDTRQGRGWCRV